MTIKETTMRIQSWGRNRLFIDLTSWAEEQEEEGWKIKLCHHSWEEDSGWGSSVLMCLPQRQCEARRHVFSILAIVS